MAIRKKTDKELQSQVEGFLEYEKGERKIDEKKSKELFDILLNKESISATKEQTKEQMVGVLNTEEFDGLYKDYCEWLEKSNKVRKNIIEKILPKEYLFLSNENFLKNYFMDSEFDDKDIEKYRIKIEKNIGIFKKYIGDSLLKEFIEVIVKYIPEYIEEVLGTLNKIGINTPEDVIKMKEPIFDGIRGENLITLNEIGINKPEDLVRLRGILRYGDSSMIKKKIDALQSIGITSVDNLVKLEKIIKEGHYVSKLIHSRLRGPFGYITVGVTDDDVIANMLLIWNLGGSVDNLVKFEDVICHGEHEGIKRNIEALKECGIITIDDLAKLQKTIIEGKPEIIKRNIEALKECGIATVDDLAKFQDCIIKGESEVIKEGIETLKYCGITSVDDLAKLQKIICGQIGIDIPRILKDVIKEKKSALVSSNLYVLMEEEGIKSIDDIAKLQDVIMVGIPDKVKGNIDTLKGLGITSVDDLAKLQKIITFGENEMILLLSEIGITSVDDLVKLDSIICSINIVPENIRANIETLKEIGVKISADNLYKLRQIICSDKTEEIKSNISILKEIGITSVEDLAELDVIIRKGYSEILTTLINMGIRNVDDLAKFEKIICIIRSFSDSEKIKGNLEALKEIGITSADDLVKLEKIIDYGKKEIIKGLKEVEITSADDLVKLEYIITHGNIKESIPIIKELKEVGITSVDNIVKLTSIINYGSIEHVIPNIKALKEIGIRSVDDFVKLGNIIKNGAPESIKNFYNMGIYSIEDFIEMEQIVTFLNRENLNKVIKLYGDIGIHTINDFPDLKRIICINGQTLESILKFFSPVQKSDIKEYQNLFSSKGLMPNDITFNEEDNKGYLKYIDRITGTGYHQDKKLIMIQKIVTLKFNEAKKYLEVFETLDASISMDVQRIKNELIEEILESDNPSEVAEQIKNIFEKNNLPLTGKIFKVFELLYPKEKFDLELQPASGEGTLGSPVLNNYKDEGKNTYRLIYKDLMNIAIKSGDRSLKEYLKTFIGSEKVLKKFEKIVGTPGFNPDDKQCLKGISNDEKEQLRYLFKKIARLSNMFLGKELKEGTQEKISNKELLNFYNEIKGSFNLRNGKSIYERLQTLLYLNGLKYHSFEEVLDKMNESKKQAHERGLKLYNETTGGKIDFPKHAFLKGVDEDAFSKIINRGVTSREYLGGGNDGNAAGSDLTPFDIDGWYTDSFENGYYGNVHLVVDTEKDTIANMGEEKGITGYDENQYELFRTGALGENHYGIRTGIPTTEVNYIIYTGNFDSKEFGTICYEIARNGYYIPITDKDGNIKFTPEMYQKIRTGFNYMEYYDGFDVEEIDGKYISKASDNEIHRDTDNVDMVKLIQENSPQNEKYRDFAKENKELAENTIEWIKRILEEKCGIKFNSKYDSSITGAELHDSGSTGRGTDIPTKDVDLDFTLILDAKDYERVAEISKVIHEEIGTQKDDDHGVIEGGNQIKSKINNIGKSDKRPNGVPLDLLILKKSQVIDYSSSDAMKEKLDYIASNPNSGVDDLDRARTNVIIMKKLLKAKGCYKKPEGGISGIGVENWIIQNHGNFIEALESFEQVAYGGEYKEGKELKALSEFQKLYPIYDAGENYKDGCNDNFVYKLEEKGYQGTLEIIKSYRLKGIDGIREIIKEYEDKKSEFIE